MAFWLVTGAEVSATRAATEGARALHRHREPRRGARRRAPLHGQGQQELGGQDWIDTAADGVFLRNGACLSVARTKILNSRFGAAILSDGKARPATSMKVLFQGNGIANFSGDGIRPIAST